MKMTALVAILTGIVCLSCAIPASLSTALLKEYRMTNNDITRLQLYISEGILLEQEATTVNKDIDETHALTTVQDSRVKQIYFKRLTPCIAIEVGSDRLRVAFESGDSLLFKLKPAKDSRGNFYVFQPETDFKDQPIERLAESGFRDWTVVGKETYKDTVYNVLVEKELPHLLVDERGIKNLEVNQQTVSGMKLSDRPVP